MSENKLASFGVSIDPEVCHGKACIAGTRIPVYDILSILADNEPAEVVAEYYYPQLSQGQVVKAIEYAAQMQHRHVAFITGDMSYQNARDRLACFEALAVEFSLDKTIVRGSFSRTNGYYLAGKLLNGPTPPTLVMTSADRQTSR